MRLVKTDDRPVPTRSWRTDGSASITGGDLALAIVDDKGDLISVMPTIDKNGWPRLIIDCSVDRGGGDAAMP